MRLRERAAAPVLTASPTRKTRPLLSTSESYTRVDLPTGLSVVVPSPAKLVSGRPSGVKRATAAAAEPAPERPVATPETVGSPLLMARLVGATDVAFSTTAEAT